MGGEMYTRAEITASKRFQTTKRQCQPLLQKAAQTLIFKCFLYYGPSDTDVQL